MENAIWIFQNAIKFFYAYRYLLQNYVNCDGNNFKSLCCYVDLKTPNRKGVERCAHLLNVITKEKSFSSANCKV